MKKLDWYIVKKFLSTFFFAIIILAVIACVIDYSEKVEDFVEKKAPAMAILNYFKNFIPHISALLFPLFIFIATIFFTSKLAYKSEIIAILASGVSFQRFLRPYLIGAGFLCALSLFANHWVVPNANKQRLAFEDKYIHSASIMSDRNVHLRLSKDLYVFVQSYDYTANVGYRFTAEVIEGQLLREKIMAERASYDSVKKIWTLFGVTIRKNDGLKESLDFVPELKKTYPNFKPSDLEEDDAIKEALNTIELDKYIAREKLRGRETLNFFYVEKHRRTAQPFAGFILTIIGVCIASKKVRGGSGLHLALGIVISATYIMAMQLSTTFATKGGLNPLIAVWIPNLIFGVLALYLYRKQIK
ncbi:LptF/LptG family permease [Polluticoccus soli]|uniref:LptF/LptG family permease n=1 Tax=Polluticoccus soli TaxID=3034150 RepID=UPI0023E2AB56|nr:LptF/LptG family permease [Flavipsychrobacter sp. JY13-12]